MLTIEEHSLLAAACRLAKKHEPGEWQEGTPVYIEEGVIKITFSDSYRCIKIALFGAQKAKFDDWLEACATRCAGRDRPRSNRNVPELGDRIIFKVG